MVDQKPHIQEIGSIRPSQARPPRTAPKRSTVVPFPYPPLLHYVLTICESRERRHSGREWTISHMCSSRRRTSCTSRQMSHSTATCYRSSIGKATPHLCSQADWSATGFCSLSARSRIPSLPLGYAGTQRTSFSALLAFLVRPNVALVIETADGW